MSGSANSLSVDAMRCRLCNSDRELRDSHVIPEFIYTPLYDDKHRFHVLSSARPHKFGQKGVRERLLCDDCEQKFSRHEKYVSEVFSGTRPVRSRRKGRLVHISGLNYHHFKLFALSVLWRAGVSSLPMFSKVKLGPHAERIRRQLLEDDPGPSGRYGVFLSPLVNAEGREQKGVIVEPTPSRLDGHHCYRFVFGGLIWVFVVSSHNAPLLFRNAFVNENGTMLMFVSTLSDMRFIMNAMREIMDAQHGRIPNQSKGT